MLRKEHTQGPQCLGFPSGPFSLLCTHLFSPFHPCLLLSVILTCKTKPQPPNLISSNMPISPPVKSQPGFHSTFHCLSIQIFSNQLYLLCLDSPHSTPWVSPLRKAAWGEPCVLLH